MRLPTGRQGPVGLRRGTGEKGYDPRVDGVSVLVKGHGN